MCKRIYFSTYYFSEDDLVGACKVTIYDSDTDKVLAEDDIEPGGNRRVTILQEKIPKGNWWPRIVFTSKEKSNV